MLIPKMQFDDEIARTEDKTATDFGLTADTSKGNPKYAIRIVTDLVHL